MNVPGVLYGLYVSRRGPWAVRVSAGWWIDNVGRRYDFPTAVTKFVFGPWHPGKWARGLSGEQWPGRWRWLHVWVADVDGRMDVILTHTVSPPVPICRRVGSILTTGWGTIRAFRVFGDEFIWRASE